jgi:hypothetical protein
MLHEITIPQFTKMLRNLDAMLDKASAYAVAKKVDEAVLLEARLALDQFAFVRQVQIACDTAKIGVARITGKEAPVHEDNEKSLAELKARVASVIAYLQTFSAQDFVGAEERRVTQPRWAGKTLSGKEFALQHMLPNFYFHITTAYAILRHNGLDVGKKDYLGAMPYREG